jgi:hypothetical protein
MQTISQTIDSLFLELLKEYHDQNIYIELVVDKQNMEQNEKKQEKKQKNTYDVKPIKAYKTYKVPKSDQYICEGRKMWKFKYTDTVRTVEYTDIAQNLEHVTALKLKHISRLLGLSNYNNSTKRELINLITPKLIFE